MADESPSGVDQGVLDAGYGFGDVLGSGGQPCRTQLVGGLHEGDQPDAGGEQLVVDLGQGIRYRQVGQVHGHHVDRVGDEPAGQLGQVRPLQVDDPGIVSQDAAQLTDSDVHGIDAADAGVEQG